MMMKLLIKSIFILNFLTFFSKKNKIQNNHLLSDNKFDLTIQLELFLS